MRVVLFAVFVLRVSLRVGSASTVGSSVGLIGLFLVSAYSTCIRVHMCTHAQVTFPEHRRALLSACSSCCVFLPASDYDSVPSACLCARGTCSVDERGCACLDQVSSHVAGPLSMSAVVWVSVGNKLGV